MPRKKKTEVWENYFHTAASKSVKCKHCDKVYQVANVNKMTNHLIKCFKCPPVIKNTLKKSTDNIAAGEVNPPLQDLAHQEQQNNTSVDTTPNTSSAEISTEKKHYLDHLLSKAIFVTGAPLSMVQHPLWTQFFNEAIPLYKLPSRKLIATTYLEAIYKDMDKEITEELKSANHLHLQCDSWSNQRNEGIINFIVSKPEPFFVKSVNTLTNRHTSVYLSQEILKVINVYGGQKFLTVIGDNANNIQRAFQMVKDRHPQIIPLRCVAHTLNLLCEDCLKLQPIKVFMPIAIEVIKAVKKSQVMSALLAKIVKDKGSGETLKLPGKTRWGSYCTALKSLLNSKVALQTLAVHEDATITDDVKSNLLDANFWTMTENCIKLLEPITNKIFKLEGNSILINEVYMAFKDIKSMLSFVLPEIVIFEDSDRDQILNAVSTRMNSCIKPIHCAAYLLDPRSQGVDLDEQHEVDAMECIHTVARFLNIDVIPDLARYRAKQGLWGK